MANRIKLNSKESMTKAEKIRRKNVLRGVNKADRSGLVASNSLNPFGKAIFNAIKKENKQLSSSDNYLLNLLASEYQIYIKMNDFVIKHGAVNDKGKKSAQYQILTTTINQILKLSNDLSLTPKNRIHDAYEKQSNTNDDPVKQAVDGDHD